MDPTTQKIQLRVLIVDDSVEDRYFYRRLLEQTKEYDYQLIEAGTGEEGLDCYRLLRPDCILLDFRLPDFDGLEFLDDLEGEQEQEEGMVPVVMVTGQGNEFVAVEAMKKGVKDYLVKDRITTDSLHHSIKNAVERVALLRELEEKNRKLKESNEQLEEFAYVASHDLQEPLRKIANFTELLASRYRDKLDAKAENYIEYIVDGATRMQQLIQDLLTYSRMGKREIIIETVDLNEVLKQAVTDLDILISDNQVQVTNDELPTCKADSAQLQRVFRNLISNAIKYRSDESPRIHISCRLSRNFMEIAVRDNGIGIEPRFSKRIFGVFQRLHSREEYSGTGIGLAICKKIVERHGGRIWIESQPGKGSTVFFTLPYQELMSSVSEAPLTEQHS